jgi:hypothetical protein
MDLLDAITKCLGLTSGNRFLIASTRKPIGGTGSEDKIIVKRILLALQTAEKTGEEARVKVSEVVKVDNWTESLAQRLLDGLKTGIEKGMAMKGPLKEAFDKAVAAAVSFAKEHPVYTTIIALGILVILLPWVIEVLGFGELGPVAGKEFIPVAARSSSH